MKVDFSNIYDFVIPMNDFSLKWRFTDPQHSILPVAHLNQLKPLNADASKFISDYISEHNLHTDVPFKKGLFKNVVCIEIEPNNGEVIKQWLMRKEIALNQKVFLSWDAKTSMIVPWQLLIEYYDDFYYPSSDDLTVIDQSLNWTALFLHYDVIYFGDGRI